MYTLAYNTTGSGCSITLMKGSVVLDSFNKATEFGQAEILIPEIKSMLNRNNLSFSDLGAVFVCVGPGSFTGVRSGVAAARVFAIAAPNLKIGGVSAFDAYKYCFEEQDITELNAVIIETRRNDFYVQLFDKNMKNITEPQTMMYAELLKTLKQKGCVVSLCGDGVERFLSQPSGLVLHAIKMEDNLSAEKIALAGLTMLKNKKIDFPKPMYLRAPDVTIPK